MARVGTGTVEGIVIEPLPSGMYRIELVTGDRILAHVAGRLRLTTVRILPGDRVAVELSTLHDSRGRIISRLK